MTGHTLIESRSVQAEPVMLHNHTLSLIKDNQRLLLKNLHLESKNLAAISWYLIRVTDKAEELCIKNLESFKKVAQEAKTVLDEVQVLLANISANA
jgi:hypothetical protein